MTDTNTPPKPTDKEKLLALLNEFGVGFTLGSPGDAHSVVCTTGDNRVDGYNGFYTKFFFDENGTFQQMGAWE